MPSADPRILVVGAGAGGLAAALELASRGVPVTVLERATGPGGKIRELDVDGRSVAAGPTVLTLRSILDELLAAAGTRLEAELAVTRAEILARHHWPDGSRLDLFADPARSEAAIAAFAGDAEARRFRAFRAEAARIWQLLEEPFLRALEPSLPGLLGGVGLRGLVELPRIRPFESIWKVLGEHFHDPRLRQLFARYATYCGGSPFHAPATLLLVVHAELSGVWLLEGALPALARTLTRLAEAHGATFRFATEVASILIEGGAVAGVRLASGERLSADAVILDVDVAAVAAGLFGAAVVVADLVGNPELVAEISELPAFLRGNSRYDCRHFAGHRIKRSGFPASYFFVFPDVRARFGQRFDVFGLSAAQQRQPAYHDLQ